jgi:hypothetical protein
MLPVSLDCFCIVFRRLVCTLYCQILWIVFVLFFFVLFVPYVASFSGWYKQDEEKQYKNNPEKLAI